MIQQETVLRNMRAWLAWGLLLWLLVVFLLAVPEPVLEKLLLIGAVVLAVSASAAVARYGVWLVAGIGGLLAFAQLKYALQPVLPLLILMTLLGFYYVLSVKFGRLLLIYLTASLLALALAEGYWAIGVTQNMMQNHVVKTRTATLPVAAVPDPDLGFRYLPDAQITETKTWQGAPIFTATYTTNTHGWRQTPEGVVTAQAAPVVFLGCSFVFGQGVADDQTLVAAFERAAQGRWQGHNFSVPGYGAHQNVRLLERELEREPLAGRVPVAGIYVAVADHVPRAAGLRFWDQGGPRYEIAPDGSAVYQGRLRDGIVGKLRELAMSAALTHRFIGYFEGTAVQERRYLALVLRMAQLFEARYHAPFSVFYWGDEAMPTEQARIAALRQAGLRVYTLRQAIPDYDPQRDNYPYDGHPKPDAQRRVGEFLAAQLQTDGSLKALP